MRDNYRWIRRLGGGSFGDVHLYQANNGEPVAIKFIAMGRSLTSHLSPLSAWTTGVTAVVRASESTRCHTSLCIIRSQTLVDTQLSLSVRSEMQRLPRWRSSSWRPRTCWLFVGTPTPWRLRCSAWPDCMQGSLQTQLASLIHIQLPVSRQRQCPLPPGTAMRVHAGGLHDVRFRPCLHSHGVRLRR